jgi:5-methyltetrahydrofolate--homocysteine methyltransferase
MIDVKAFKKCLLKAESTPTEKLVQKYLNQGTPAEVILNKGLIGALELVGQDWKVKKLWVPDVLLAAQNIHKGIDFLRPIILEDDIPCKGVFLIGTVQGDIHDIGKNIVVTLMEAHGFRVIDLGVNVPTGTFADAVAMHKPDIVGVSALLTTTMVEMKNVIAVVRKSGLVQGPKVIVGGAPVTQKFADEIGADGYGEDAISGVEIAFKLLADRK